MTFRPLRPAVACAGRLACLALLAAAWSGGAVGSSVAADMPPVAAASDVQFALQEIARGFSASTGRQVRLAFGSTGVFATQIRSGAPFQLFLAGDEDYVLRLRADGLVIDDGALYAIGRLALVASPASALQVDAELRGLVSRAREGSLRRFAIANPEHAPYGRRAEEVLRRLGIWDVVKPRLVLGENVSQAAQFAIAGGTDGGLVSLSLALAPHVRGRLRYAVVPDAWHTPLRQRMALVRGAGETARAFYRYLQQPAAREVLRRYGFGLPEAR